MMQVSVINALIAAALLGTAAASPAPSAVADAAPAASPTPAPGVSFTTRFVQGDTKCAFTASTSQYPYNTCNNVGDSYSWSLTAPVGTTAYVYSGSNCTGHLISYPATDDTCHAPVWTDGFNGAAVRSFVVPWKNCAFGC